MDATEGCDPPLKGPAVKASLVRAHEPSELDPDNNGSAKGPNWHDAVLDPHAKDVRIDAVVRQFELPVSC